MADCRNKLHIYVSSDANYIKYVHYILFEIFIFRFLLRPHKSKKYQN